MRFLCSKKQRGISSVIVVVLISTFLMTALLLGLQKTNIVVFDLTNRADSVKALYLAESGLERAAYRFKSVACTSLIEAAVPFADGTIELSSAVVNGSACDIQVKAVVNSAVRVLAVSLAGASSGYEAWAVGKNGVIIGRSAGVWAIVTSNVPKELKAVACSDANYCLAVGKDGWVSVWDGTVWTSSQIDNQEKYSGVSCSPSDSNLCVIVGKGDTAEGVIRIWNRSSANPGSIKFDAAKELTAVDCPGSSCVAAGKEQTNAFVTRGNASSWTTETSDVGEKIKGVSCIDSTATNCFGVTKKSGNKFRLALRPGSGSTDWQEITGSFGASSGDINDLNAISCLSTGVCWAVGKKGHALKYDSGWSYITRANSSDLKGVSCRESDGACLAVGKNGSVVRWPGAGTTWSSETSSTGEDLKAVAYLPDGGGSGGVLLNSWQEVVSGS